MQVEKGRKITQIGGDDWDRFIAHMRLSGGELISFSFRRDRPRISIIYLNLIPDSEDEVHEEEDGADSDDDDSDDDRTHLLNTCMPKDSDWATRKSATSGTCFRYVKTTSGCHS